MYVRVNEIPKAGLDAFAGQGKETIPRLLEGMDPYPLKSCRLSGAGLVLSVEGRSLYARGSFAAEGEAQCDRCAEPFPVRFEKEFSAVLMPRDSASTGPMNVELKGDELDVAFHDGIGVEVSDIFWEQVAMELPVQLLCRDDCRGICPTCGTNRNLDRCDCTGTASTGPFDGLRTLLEKKE